MSKTVGLILIVVGLIVLIWGGIGFKTREKVIDLGPIEATKETTHHLPYAPIAGGLVIIGGVALLVAGRRVTG